MINDILLVQTILREYFSLDDKVFFKSRLSDAREINILNL